RALDGDRGLDASAGLIDTRDALGQPRIRRIRADQVIVFHVGGGRWNGIPAGGARHARYVWSEPGGLQDPDGRLGLLGPVTASSIGGSPGPLRCGRTPL